MSRIIFDSFMHHYWDVEMVKKETEHEHHTRDVSLFYFVF